MSIKLSTMSPAIAAIVGIAITGIIGTGGQLQIALAQGVSSQHVEQHSGSNSGNANLLIVGGFCPPRFENCNIQTILAAVGCPAFQSETLQRFCLENFP